MIIASTTINITIPFIGTIWVVKFASVRIENTQTIFPVLNDLAVDA
ncbi:MAG: hypothetical protein ACI9AT_002073 [Ulvibacter sp.]|jgi:hypothetical protein